MMRIVRGLLVAASAALLTACAVGPNYKRPTMDLSGAFKEQDGWKPSEPADAIDRGKWWEIYHDDVLNGLEDQINISNQTVLAAAAADKSLNDLVEDAIANVAQVSEAPKLRPVTRPARKAPKLRPQPKRKSVSFLTRRLKTKRRAAGLRGA